MLKRKYYTGEQIHEAIDGVVGDYKKAIEIYRRLAKMETDDVQPVKLGKWKDGNKKQTCSECLYRGYRSWHYCPNCGARMGEVSDEHPD